MPYFEEIGSNLIALILLKNETQFRIDIRCSGMLSFPIYNLKIFGTSLRVRFSSKASLTLESRGHDSSLNSSLISFMSESYKSKIGSFLSFFIKLVRSANFQSSRKEDIIWYALEEASIETGI